jgi:hypothetical protein
VPLSRAGPMPLYLPPSPPQEQEEAERWAPFPVVRTRRGRSAVAALEARGGVGVRGEAKGAPRAALGAHR